MKQKGQSLAEFALVLPVLALLIFGLLDLGRAVYMYNTLANAARTGARVASVNQNADTNGTCNPLNRTDWSIVACILEIGISIPITRSDIDIQYVGSSCVPRQLDPACIAQVTVVQDYVPFTPIIGDLIGTIQLRATSEMPVEAWFP